jgi:hypothetical protein
MLYTQRQIAYGCSVRCASELSTTMTLIYEQIITQLKTLSAQNKVSAVKLNSVCLPLSVVLNSV